MIRRGNINVVDAQEVWVLVIIQNDSIQQESAPKTSLSGNLFASGLFISKDHIKLKHILKPDKHHLQ